MQVTVAFVNGPKTDGGKWSSIKDSNGSYWGFDNTKLSFDKGSTYEIESTSKDVNGKTYHTITRATKANGGAGGSSSAGGDRWYMPFVSNTVAHAISSGLIKDASQIHQWAVAAKRAAVALENPPSDYADDDQPAY